jgi:hypothetical protein
MFGFRVNRDLRITSESPVTRDQPPGTSNNPLGARLFYSYLKATMGSTRNALRAGM